jgi:predicted 2-oxoglutarate/Fe(II)-dependent dioxygenase YbiX
MSLGGTRNDSNAELWDTYDEIYKLLKSCVDDYCRYWGINVTYYEIFNFVKYEGEGKEFKIHADDGPAYKAAVSAVIYLNDDYEGGEIYFPRMDGKIIKPDAGDIAIFPSNYVMEHASLPIKSGTKYCVVIMMDLNDLAHRDFISGSVVSGPGY